jgi:signal transduction histidine kinase
MRERMEAVGGSLQVGPAPGGGTTITLAAPMG